MPSEFSVVIFKRMYGYNFYWKKIGFIFVCYVLYWFIFKLPKQIRFSFLENDTECLKNGVRNFNNWKHRSNDEKVNSIYNIVIVNCKNIWIIKKKLTLQPLMLNFLL